MAKTIKSRTGRFVAGLVLAGALGGLVLVIQASTEQRSWDSTEGTVRERLKSGKSASVKVEFALPDGAKQTATLSENGPIRKPASR